MNYDTYLFDYADVFERFAIMTIDGKQDIDVAFNYCKKNTSLVNAKKLKDWIEECLIKQTKFDFF